MPRRAKYSDELIDTACRKWANRITYKSLAGELGVDPKDINYVINTLGKEILKKYEKQLREQRDTGISQGLQISNEAFNGAEH